MEKVVVVWCYVLSKEKEIKIFEIMILLSSWTPKVMQYVFIPYI